MTFQLDLRQKGAWNPVRASSDRVFLVNFKNAALDSAHHTGYRIFNADRKRLKSGELAGMPQPCRKQSPGTRHVADLARDAAEHITKTGQKTISVYPLGKTGSHVSNQFRRYLFGRITERIGDWSTDLDRVKSEAIATKEMGYTIIEVDPDEWVFTPDLEEAA